MEIPTNIFEHESGYPLMFVHKKTNEIICETCARAMNSEELSENFVYDIFHEGSDLNCDECNEIMESACGNPDNKIIDSLGDL